MVTVVTVSLRSWGEGEECEKWEAFCWKEWLGSLWSGARYRGIYRVSAETWESHLFSAPAEILPVEGRDAGTPGSDGEGAKTSPPSLCPPAGCYWGLEHKMAKPEMSLSSLLSTLLIETGLSTESRITHSASLGRQVILRAGITGTTPCPTGFYMGSGDLNFGLTPG